MYVKPLNEPVNITGIFIENPANLLLPLYEIKNDIFQLDTNQPLSPPSWTDQAVTNYIGTAAGGSVTVDNDIYVIGGFDNMLRLTRKVYKFTKTDGTWNVTSLESMPEDRGYFGIAEVNRVIYIIGGTTYDIENLDWLETLTVTAYDIKTNKWFTPNNSNFPVSYDLIKEQNIDGISCMQTASVFGRVYVFGDFEPDSGDISSLFQFYKP